MDGKIYDKGSTIFALDIGTRSVVGLLGSHDGKKIVIHHSAMEFHQSRAMFDGQIHDIEQVVAIAKKVKEELEEKAGFPLKEVAIAAAGRALKTYRVEIEKELDENKSIDRHLLNSIEIEGLQKAQKQLEAREQETTNYFCVGHTVISNFLNDGMITNPIGHRGRKLKMDILATFLPHGVVDSLNTVMNKVGLDVTYMTLEPIAAIEVAVPQNIRLLNIAMVDIGAGTSDIAITKDGTVIAYAMTSTAGDEITEAIAKAYLLDFDTAEKVKCQLCKENHQCFTDILGMQHEMATEAMLDAIQPAIENIGKEIAENILIQNEKAPSAIFLIGGGSQIPRLNEIIANYLEMPKERVVVRGTEIIQNLQHENLLVTGPEGITPVGILAKALENKSKDFIDINVNGKDMRLFQSKKLKVSDALVLMGFNPRDLIPKRGTSLSLTVNGIKRFFYGEYGQPAEIYVNGVAGNLDTPIKGADRINVIPAKQGRDALCFLRDVVDLNQSILLKGEAVSIIKEITLNGEVIVEDKALREGDLLHVTLFKTVEELFHYYKIPYGSNIQVNGVTATLFDYIKAGDEITMLEEALEKPTEDKAENLLPPINNDIVEDKKLRIYYNGNLLEIPQVKEEMVFVDIFDYINFDRYKLQGKLVLQHNGVTANYLEPLLEGDEVVIKWEK